MRYRETPLAERRTSLVTFGHLPPVNRGEQPVLYWARGVLEKGP